MTSIPGALLLITLTASLCPAQPADEGQPATTNVMGAEYPRVHADRSVTFRVEAPNARKMLDDAGIEYVYFESPGTAHEWLTWRRDLKDFAPRLF